MYAHVRPVSSNAALSASIKAHSFRQPRLRATLNRLSAKFRVALVVKNFVVRFHTHISSRVPNRKTRLTTSKNKSDPHLVGRAD